jgi:PRC-barrel domain
MRRTFLATTALASMLAFGAAAQQATDPAAPAMDAPAEIAPDSMAPESMAPDSMAPEATEPAADAGDETMPATEPAIDTAQDPATPDATTPGMAPMDPAVTDAGPVLTPVESGDISADTLIGATIQTFDGDNIATVEDVLVSADGAVENVVAEFGGFLGFGSNTVLLTMDEIEVLQDEGGAFVVQTSLTPQALEGRPDYVAEN